KVSSDVPQLIKPYEKSLLRFNVTEIDIINNVITPDRFVIQTTGTYNITGDFTFEASSVPFNRTIEICVNGRALATDESPSTRDSVTVSVSRQIPLKTGDILQIKAYLFSNTERNSFSGMENNMLRKGFSLSALYTTSDAVTSALAGSVVKSGGSPLFTTVNDGPGTLTTAEKEVSGSVAGKYVWGSSGAGQKTSPASTSIVSLMALYTNADGKMLPIHPETDTPVVPYLDGVSLNGGNPNDTIVVAMAYGMEYQITLSASVSS
ncbi:MAG: hypothetical protein WCQ50_22510, partial [Spirochaetota bacterium]